MSVDTGVALVLFLFPLAYSPGPGNAFFAGIGASAGLRAAVPGLIGYHAATFVVTAALGIGMGETVLTNPVVARSLAALGGLYVLWLAVQFIRSARTRTAEAADAAPVNSPRIGFWAGAVVLLLNPKAYYIIAMMFTQFLRAPADGITAVPAITPVLAITTVFALNNLIAFTVWTLAGTTLALLFRSPRSKRRLDYVFAATLIGVAVWMAVPLFASP